MCTIKARQSIEKVKKEMVLQERSSALFVTQWTPLQSVSRAWDDLTSTGFASHAPRPGLPITAGTKRGDVRCNPSCGREAKTAMHTLLY